MKKYYYLHLFLLLTLGVKAQQHDNNWIFGISNQPFNVPNGVIVHFDQGYPTFSIENIRQYYGPYCAIASDSSGNLLFHTNGRAIRNRMHQIMENGDSINPGRLWKEFIFGYPSATSGFAVPAPCYSNRYYLIHTSAQNDFPVYPYFPVLYSSTIDMNANGGLGKVISKNDTLAMGDIPSPVAIKHGNGRDWWLIVGDYLNKKYQTFLIDPGGIHFMFDQNIAPEAFSSTSGYHLASPDGNHFINNDDVSGLWIYDFDRCTGLLSHPRVLPYQPPEFFTSTNAFSSNSRFLYVGTHLVVYQLDMQTIDAPAIAFDTIGRYEYGASPSPPAYTHFLTPKFAHDGRVYYTTFSSTNTYHVLNQPEAPLLASDFSQRGVILPKNHDETTYIFPSYTLGRLSDSPCDTLPFAGPSEERFRHIAWEPPSSQADKEMETVHIMHLPSNFHIPDASKGAPDNPLSPVRLLEQATHPQRQKAKDDDHEK